MYNSLVGQVRGSIVAQWIAASLPGWMITLMMPVLFLMGQWGQSREGGWHVNETSVLHFIEVAFARSSPPTLRLCSVSKSGRSDEDQ